MRLRVYACVFGQTLEQQQRALGKGTGSKYYLIHESGNNYPFARKEDKCDYKDDSEDHWHEGPEDEDHDHRA